MAITQQNSFWRKKHPVGNRFGHILKNGNMIHPCISNMYIKSPPWVIPFHFNYIPREKNQNLMFYSLYFKSHTIPRSNAITIISSLLVFFSAIEYILPMMFINTFIQSKLPLPAYGDKRMRGRKICKGGKNGKCSAMRV